MKKYILSLILMSFLSCGKDTPPGPPEVSILIFPTQNLDCAQGTLVNVDTRRIPFEWMASKGAESYELQITQLSNEQKTNQSTLLNTLEVPLKMGEAYSWKVVASNTKVLETTSSALWYFFNAGAQTTHAPFPATALSPLSGSILSMPSNGLVTIKWSGADVDNDIVSFSLLLGTENPPITQRSLGSATASEFNLNVSKGVTYYWQVKTKDQAGNETPSQVFDFKIQ